MYMYIYVKTKGAKEIHISAVSELWFLKIVNNMFIISISNLFTLTFQLIRDVMCNLFNFHMQFFILFPSSWERERERNKNESTHVFILCVYTSEREKAIILYNVCITYIWASYMREKEGEVFIHVCVCVLSFWKEDMIAVWFRAIFWINCSTSLISLVSSLTYKRRRRERGER